MMTSLLRENYIPSDISAVARIPAHQPNGLSSFQSRATLPLEANGFWKIEEGLVRTLTWNEEGEVSTLGLWGVGDIVGRPLSALVAYQIECITPVQAVPLSVIHSHLPELLRSHIQQMEALLSIAHTKQVNQRLLQLLRWLADRFGIETERGWIINVRLTHQILADLIGTTRVTITRLLKQLEHQNKLTRLNHHRLLLHESCHLHDRSNV